MKTVSRLSFLIGLTACIAFSQGPKSAIQFYDSSSQNKTVQFGWTGTKDAGHFFVELPDGKSMTLTNGNLNEGYLTVDYEKLVPVLVEAIKEQQKTIDLLNSKLTTIEKRINEIEN